MALEIFRLVGSVFVDTDGADKSLQNTDKKAQNFGQTLLGGVKTAAKWAAGVAAAAGTAAAALSVASIQSYADYEQLVGGVETLFKDSSGTILKYAEGAYKTAGLTANQYMETVTSFSASLLQSLGWDTAEAAEYAHMAIVDMSDNANKMGTDMSMIQNAYQGFAKQNYTMLDNLKLGYGGTQKEMYRLLQDAKKLDETFDADFSLSSKGTLEADFADIVQAIHIVQTQMGITGTTAAEAEGTISGSINMIKAKLENFKTTIGAALAPVVKQFLGFVVDKLPAIESGVNEIALVWIPALVSTLTDCAKWISENSDKIVEWTGYIVAAGVGVGTFLLYMNWGTIMTAASAALHLVTGAIKKMGMALASNPIGLVISLIAALIAYLGYLYATNEDFRAFADKMLSAIWAKLQDVIAWIQQNIMPVIDAILGWLSDTIGTFWDWLTSSFQSAGDSVGGIWETIKGYFQTAWDFIVSIWEACQPFFQGVWDGVFLPVWGLIQEVIGAFQMAWDVIKLVWGYVEPYFSAIWEGIKTTVYILWTLLSTGFKNAWEMIKLVWSIAVSYFAVVWEGIKGVFSVVVTYLGGLFRTAWEVIKAVWNVVIAYFTLVWAGIKAVFAVVKGVLSGDFTDAWEAIKNVWDKTKNYFRAIWDGITGVFGSAGRWFGDTFKAAWEAIKKVFSAWGSFFGGLWDKITNTFSKIGTNIGEAISKSVRAGLNGVISAIEGIINTGVNLINGAINLINEIPGVSIGKLSKLKLPRLERGGVLERGQVGLLEGNGAEAVVPLHQNQKWISAVARDMDTAMGGASGSQVVAVLLDILAALEELTGMGIYLDTNALVGGLAKPMDKKLGQLQAMKARA